MSLDAVGVISRNILKSVEFYALLGIELKETGGPDHWEGTTTSGVRLMLDSVDLVKKLMPDWQEPTGTAMALCFKQASPAAVDRLHAAIIEAGFESIAEPWDAFWGQRYASIRDPDGNHIDLFAAL